MWWLLCGAAWGGDRDPLPARWIERPLVLPRGWVRVEGRVSPGPGDPDRQGAVELGIGVLPRVEVVVEAVQPRIGVRLAVWRREPPNQSVAIALSATSPRNGSWPELSLGIGARQQLGPLAADVGIGPTWVEGPGLRAEAGLLLQAGPLVLEGHGIADLDQVRLEGGLRIQWSRGVWTAASVVTGPDGAVPRLGAGVAL